MAGDRLSWAGLLKWSLSYVDGAGPSRAVRWLKRVLVFGGERRWLAEAVERHMMVDVVSRMREIALLMSTPPAVLEAQGITHDDIEDFLSELQVHVESIDMANDPDLTARIKALGALSSLIRNNKPGVSAFRLANGYTGLRDALNSESARFQRKALSLTHYLLSESHSDCSVFAQLGFPHLMMRLASSDDSGVREAALGGLLELARDTTLGNRSLLAEHDSLRGLLRGRMESIRTMTPEDLDAAREERQLVDSLWITCYHEPSMLRNEGLLVLPGEESFEQPPDVAGRFFEPIRRAAARRAPPVERSDPGVGTGGGMVLLLGPAPDGRSNSPNH
ncbi:unnamed protein product [Miscanthus lutarioriparius]|uniref:Nucleotide exchange factor Fes1 domain-containing protein n=1 Tax=Miscanthus lutarioriparius TaxID=422564 RepID=A0A811MUL0_9POAL|nr:unnamed protein product [Miscanthus lutarioriparius]